MNLGIENKKAIITGASRGLGQAMAIALAREGVKVAVVARNKQDLNTVLKQMGGIKNGHYAVAYDLMRSGAPDKLIVEIKKRFGEPDILVNNLGGLYIRDPFCPIEKWREVWRMNLEITIEMNNLVIPIMKKKKWGRIVNISSVAAAESQGPFSYGVVKSALTAYTKRIARMVAPDGIVMTAILPGAVYTKGGYWDITSKTNPEHVRKYKQERMPLRRLGNPEEIGSFVAYLCSQQASFCVGSCITVDGGQSVSFTTL